MSSAHSDACAVVIGAGARQGIGAAVAIKAASEGMHVFVAGRTDEKIQALVDEIQAGGGQATAVVTDSTREEDIKALFDQVAATGKPLGLVLYNTGRNIPAPFMESDTDLIEGHWRRCVLGAMLAGQAAVRQMLSQDTDHKGTIIFTGASASMRGKPLFDAFASAKASARVMAQSMAREFGPQGIHVAHIVIDGAVDGNVIRSAGPLGKMLLKSKGASGALLPDEIAKSFWMVHTQHRSAWTHEMDLRPYKESF